MLQYVCTKCHCTYKHIKTKRFNIVDDVLLVS